MKTTLKNIKKIIKEVVSASLVESGIYANDVWSYLERAIPAATADELDAFTDAVAGNEDMDGQLLSDEVRRQWPWLTPETADDIAADLFDILTDAWRSDPKTGQAYEPSEMRALQRNEAVARRPLITALTAKQARKMFPDAFAARKLRDGYAAYFVADQDGSFHAVDDDFDIFWNGSSWEDRDGSTSPLAHISRSKLSSMIDDAEEALAVGGNRYHKR